MRRGFTLIQISLLLIAASLVLVAVLPSTRTALNGNNDSTVKMNAVLTAMRAYEATKAALPCPADASQPIGSTSYGVAAANPGTTTNCTGGSPAANYVDATNNVAVGMVPVRALGLSNDYALDAFGRDITYAVDTNATVCFSGTLPGQITVTDNGTANSTIAALVSHGGDGHGAWVPLTGSSGTAVRLNAGSTDADQLTNAHLNSSFTPVTPLTNFVKKMPTPTFDDLVIYKSTLWTLNKSPTAASVLLPTITPPSNGNYFTTQTLTFLVTYGSPATVTGTPQLTFVAPQLNASPVTRTANYVSGSGTSVLTFTYTVAASDYTPTAPSGISMSSPIGLNGGSITVAGAAACLTFTPPSLSAVLLNPPTIYVADGDNDRVQWFNVNGTYLGQVSTSSVGSPGASAGDKSGNIWTSVGDNLYQFSAGGTLLNTITNAAGFVLKLDATGNLWTATGMGNCVIELSSTATGQNGQVGPYTMRIGPVGGAYYWCATGSGVGEFSSAGASAPNGIAFDVSGNIWATDSGNYRVQKFTSSGAYLMTIGGGSSCTSCVSTTSCTCTAGTGNGLFNGTQGAFGVAVDAAGNVFVTDYNNDLVHEFNSSGAFMMQFGSLGDANGQFGSNWSGPEGIAIDPNGNLWVADLANNRVEEFTECGIYLNSIGAGYNGVSGAQTSAGSGNGQFSANRARDVFITGPLGGGGACIASITPPSGTYTTGQTLTFTVTYNMAVTVTGTPQLVLTMGSNTRYANYASGSGTTTLTFTYTIQASDTATSVATPTSIINLNGGSITTVSNGLAASGSYTPLSLGLVINLNEFMLVADSGNNRVQKLTLTGGFIDQLGCASGNCTAASANGQFSNPNDVAVDGSGNIWVTDSANNRVQEFSSSGVWSASIGGPTPFTCETSPAGTVPACVPGTGNGQFNGTQGITFDSGGNLW